MSPKRSVWVLAMLLCAALLAGCGSSSSTTTSTASSTPAASTQATSATSTVTKPTSTTPSTTTPTATSTAPTATTPGGTTSSSIAQLAATVCNSTAARSNLPAAMKIKVEQICHEAATGHQSQAEETARKVCVEAIEAIPGPKTATREKALKECNAAK